MQKQSESIRRADSQVDFPSSGSQMCGVGKLVIGCGYSTSVG